MMTDDEMQRAIWEKRCPELFKRIQELEAENARLREERVKQGNKLMDALTERDRLREQGGLQQEDWDRVMAENARLRKRNDVLEEDACEDNGLADIIEEQRAEIAKLREENAELYEAELRSLRIETEEDDYYARYTELPEAVKASLSIREAVERSLAGGLVAYVNRLRVNHACTKTAYGRMGVCKCGEPGCAKAPLLLHIDDLLAAYQLKVDDLARETAHYTELLEAVNKVRRLRWNDETKDFELIEEADR